MTDEHVVTVYGTPVMVCAPDGLPLDAEGAATELVGEAIGQRAEVVVVPTERLTDDFFDVGTGVAERIAQKFDTYRVRLAVVGDIAERVAASPALATWVDGSNTGTRLWFSPTFDDFQTRLDRRRSPRAM
ncbi:DUF4180 domain-containing protein [Aeromicrobium fastidiosum]|uniref:DUF4180 domain-containing protein n=1 Tax=Aeromicrobium fastidiosum TaxID=52699 RepID=A0A641ASR2_9ACTN|nr:DUF4180 domain-containing protein [Aeromicrobium fastidiosum]KAA1380567.1 DUF4180 domain-containing protein [Aeromicrobium fastidiosum]MBP2390161.1 hypothetical protein [Aeromicrobium fastidiosum]